MSRIVYDGPGDLHITDIGEAREMPKDDLDRVITVCQDSIEDNVSDDVVYSFHNMADGEVDMYGGHSSYYMFEQATHELFEALESGESVLIHCHFGQSRSVSVATAALGRLLTLSWSESLEIVRRYRITDHPPNDALLDHASDYLDRHGGEQ